MQNSNCNQKPALQEKAGAIVEAWYPGFFGARAIARALMGKTNRWGKLPVTIYDETFMDQFETGSMLKYMVTVKMPCWHPPNKTWT